MHRHGYQGRKLHRDQGQRRALLRGLAISLIDHGSIETTLPKAKELVPFLEVLITKAKAGGLHNRRQVLSALDNTNSTFRLMDELVPKLMGRNSGHLRIVKSSLRLGDNAQLASVSFVDDLNAAPVAEKKLPASKETK